MIRLITVMLLFFIPVLAQEEEQSHLSIVEIARETRAKRALNSNPPIIITNANLKSFQRAVSRTISSASQAEVKPLPGEANTDAWNSIFAQATADLEVKLARKRNLEEKMTALSNGWVPIIDGRIEGTLQEQLQETQQALQDNQAELEEARRVLEELRTQAGRDGVPPGAIREMMTMTAGK